MVAMKSPIAQTSIPAMESKTIEINSRAFPSTSVINNIGTLDSFSGTNKNRHGHDLPSLEKLEDYRATEG